MQMTPNLLQSMPVRLVSDIRLNDKKSTDVPAAPITIPLDLDGSALTDFLKDAMLQDLDLTGQQLRSLPNGSSKNYYLEVFCDLLMRSQLFRHKALENALAISDTRSRDRVLARIAEDTFNYSGQPDDTGKILKKIANESLQKDLQTRFNAIASQFALYSAKKIAMR